MSEKFIIKITRSTTQDRKRVEYTCVNRDNSVVHKLKASDTYAWKRFLAGQLSIYSEAWIDQNTKKLVIGKAVEGETW